jgi:hypothetical protein
MGKKRNRDDIEDRTMAYRDERREYPYGYTQDVDQLEYSFLGDEIIFVASLELTRVDYNPKYPNGPTPRYFEVILERFYHDCQAKLSVEVADRLGIEAYIVAFSEDVKRFWVYNLSKKQGWKAWTDKQYFKWLENKHCSAIQKRIEEKEMEHA